MKNISAFLDENSHSASVCDYAIWAAEKLQAPLHMLHILARRLEQPAGLIKASSLQFASQDALLRERLENQQIEAALAATYGQQLLAAARIKAAVKGLVGERYSEQQGLLETLLPGIEQDAQWVVAGLHHFRDNSTKDWTSTSIASELRSLQRPLLVSAEKFTPPSRFVLAFDGLLTGFNAVEAVAASALLKGSKCHLVMAVGGLESREEKMIWARSTLEAHGFDVSSSIVAGAPQKVLHEAIETHAADLLVMGAYGHAKDRQMVVGSTIAGMLRTSPISCLVLR